MDEQLILFVRTVVVPQYWEAPNGRGVRHLNDVLESARCLVGRELVRQPRIAKIKMMGS